MANHHIISHTGVVSTWELLRGAVNTFNLGFDMALLTVIAATLSGGDPVTWTLSIGGPDPRVEAPLGGLLGLLGALFFLLSSFLFFFLRPLPLGMPPHSVTLSLAVFRSCFGGEKREKRKVTDPIAKIQANPKASNIPTTSSKSTPP